MPTEPKREPRKWYLILTPQNAVYGARRTPARARNAIADLNNIETPENRGYTYVPVVEVLEDGDGKG